MARLRGAYSGAVFIQLERLFHHGTSTGSTEGELLERFVTGRDEAAFEAMVARHGPMVLGVCRQLLRDPNDVDDAFQATFLVWFARRVRSAAATCWVTGSTASPTGWRFVREACRRGGRPDSRRHIDAVEIWRPRDAGTDAGLDQPSRMRVRSRSPGCIRRSATCRRSIASRSCSAISRA